MDHNFRHLITLCQINFLAEFILSEYLLFMPAQSIQRQEMLILGQHTTQFGA